jgi:hypothetical protein
MFSSQSGLFVHFKHSLFAFPDDQRCRDVDVLLSCLRLVSQALKGDPENFFEQDLYYAVADPVQLAKDFADYILKNLGSVSLLTAVCDLEEIYNLTASR